MTASTPKRVSGSKLPWLFVAFFAVVFAANGVLVYFAAQSWTGLETKGYYIKGLDHNRTLATAAQQKALGWLSDLSADRTADGALLVRFGLQDGRREGVSGARVKARFVRPTHVGHDFELLLRESVPGRYRATAEAPLPGQWDIRITAEHRAGTYRLHRRVVLP